MVNVGIRRPCFLRRPNSLGPRTSGPSGRMTHGLWILTSVKTFTTGSVSSSLRDRRRRVEGRGRSEGIRLWSTFGRLGPRPSVSDTLNPGRFVSSHPGPVSHSVFCRPNLTRTGQNSCFRFEESYRTCRARHRGAVGTERYDTVGSRVKDGRSPRGTYGDG